METTKRLFISLLVFLSYTAGAWAIEQDSDGYYLIGSVQDWQDFAALVNGGTTDINARMIADIDLGDDQTMIGDTRESTSSPCFSGIFDGQGYTLTVAYTGIGSSSVGAPFAKINGATIKNLHVKGSLSSAGFHPTSIVSDSWGTSRLEKVWGEVDITGTRTGWVEASGLVGCMKAGNLTIEDCLFTGTVNGTGSYNGCFIGYIDRGSATITNSLSTGTFTYSGGDNGFRGTHTNCYVKQFPATIPTTMQLTDEELEDGTITAKLQADRSEEVWAQDPLTNQPMLKIFTTLRQDEEGYYLIGSVTDWRRFAELVNSGTNTAANAKMIKDVDLGDDQTYISPTWHGEFSNLHYHGTFDGQGHTLTVHYSSSNMWHTPFSQTSGATIKNLHVAGTIKSTSSEPSHMSGLISNSAGNDVIEKVWVSADITGGSHSWIECGAFVGCNNCGNTTIKDCLFTGSITTTGGNNGCFVGWVQSYNPSSVTTTNCLSTGTFSLGSNNSVSRGTLNNCYVKSYPASIPTDMQLTDEELENGTITAKLQADRSEEVWVQDPETNQPMLKIFAEPYEEVEYFLIGSLQDWKDFAELVETEPTTNGKLIADVDLGDDQTMVGSLASPYQGIFDGQGYTLTVNYDMNLTTSAVAPFAVVGNAVIQKLHVAGSIKQQYCAAGGVVGSIMGNATIRECWVSAYMYVQGYGNLQGTIGGIASCCDNSNARNCTILIEDCVFTGEMATGYHCGSIMSHVNGGYGNSAVIKNCLALGTYASAIGSTGTFIRVGTQGDPYSLENCYYKTSWGAVQGTQATAEELADGTTAAALQADRTKEVWMQDPNTNLPMLKIFVKPNAGALNGMFTINASGDKVVFSQGNLQKVGDMYQFANNQYDYFGTDQSDTRRDMFAFLDYSNPDVDESWFMLSHDEWKYLLITRSVTNTLSDGARYTMATLGDTYKGLIIFPDYYEHPEGTGFMSGVFNSNSNYTAKVSLEGWAMMEAAGCVFLPAAGYCSGGSTWYGVGEEIGYMSCTQHPKYISTYYSPYITLNGVYVDETSNYRTWTSIRLVLLKPAIHYTVPASGVGTFSSALNVNLPEGLNAHYCKTYIAERSAIKVVNISGSVVPANTGVLLSGTPGETFTLTPTNEVANIIEDNELVAVTESKHVPATDGDYTNFMMKGGKFIKIQQDDGSVKMPANRAYLPLLTSAISGSNAKEIMLYWDDEEATGIESLTPGPSPKGEGSIYNLNGQKLSAPQKGINIINGRKVIVN